MIYPLTISRIPEIWDEYQKALDRAAHGCPHPIIETRYIDQVNGRRYFEQCITCGKRIGPVQTKKVKDINSIKPFDFDLRELDLERRYREYAELKIVYTQRVAEWNKNFINRRKQFYNWYMNSDEWKSKRRLALDRDGYLCQQCHRNRAVHVHHTTYARLGHEDLSDLMSVCVSCHEDIHGRPI